MVLLKKKFKLELLRKWNIHTFDIKLIKRVRIVKRTDGFYVQFCIKVAHSQPARDIDAQIDIDLASEYFYSGTNSNHFPNPRYLSPLIKLNN